MCPSETFGSGRPVMQDAEKVRRRGYKAAALWLLQAVVWAVVLDGWGRLLALGFFVYTLMAFFSPEAHRWLDRRDDRAARNDGHGRR